MAGPHRAGPAPQGGGGHGAGPPDAGDVRVQFPGSDPGDGPRAGPPRSRCRRAGIAAVEAVPGGLATMLGAAGVVVTPAAVRRLRAARILARYHLIQVSSLMSAGGARRRRRWRWANPGPWTAGWTGGQAGRAGFDYLRTVMARDWQFRRNMAQVLPGPDLRLHRLARRRAGPVALRPGLRLRALPAPPVRHHRRLRVRVPRLRQRPQGHLVLRRHPGLRRSPVRARHPRRALPPADRRAPRRLAALAGLVVGRARRGPVRGLQHGRRVPVPGLEPQTDRGACRSASRRRLPAAPCCSG